ncbi:hypothetical protein SO802_010339 [Lithocarpus litseifolius]|uniref:Stalled ribosome sensor GCN1-like N-terminal domain-containing protein n=1 Tax=Lithocarpus litseifolius TaxID=425828 RepID=A0AAW2DG81_9ROSI
MVVFLRAVQQQLAPEFREIRTTLRSNKLCPLSELAFVTQEDILLGTLTIRETITYSANLRLPTSMTIEEVNGIVEGTFIEMGLQECADRLIGNWHLRAMCTELASLLVDIIFRTLLIYDDRGSRKAVDDLIAKALGDVLFMKNFAAALVQAMERQLKVQSHVGCYRLLRWSCLLLSRSQFATVSKNALCRVAAAQASLLHIVVQRSFRERRACKQTFFNLFSQPTYLHMYVKTVLNAREKPAQVLCEAVYSLFTCISYEYFQSIVVPSSVKMLKRNPEIVLESVGILLKSVNLDLSKYATEILLVVLPQARHADEGRRVGALAIVRSLSQKSSNPDALEAMFNAVKAVIGGSEGRLAFPYQRIGMVNVLQELSNAPEGKYVNGLSRAICVFLLSYYKDDGNEEVKLAILSAVASWAARSADAIQPDLVSFIASGLKEKEALRRGHLRCLRGICKNADAVLQVSSLLGPLVQLVKTSFTKAVQRLDGIDALLLVGKITALDIKAEETVAKEKIWSLISQNEPSLVPISLVAKHRLFDVRDIQSKYFCGHLTLKFVTQASKLSTEDCMACVDLLEVLLVEHLRSVLDTFSVRLLLQLMIFLICHPSWDIRRMAYNATRKIITAAPQLSEDLLLEFTNFLSVVGEKIYLSKTRYNLHTMTC